MAASRMSPRDSIAVGIGFERFEEGLEVAMMRALAGRSWQQWYAMNVKERSQCAKIKANAKLAAKEKRWGSCNCNMDILRQG